MEPSEYAKAVLYRELGIFSEPLDQRRKVRKKKQRQEAYEWRDEEKDIEPEELEAGRGCTNP